MTGLPGALDARRAAGFRLAAAGAALVAGEVVLWRAGTALPTFPPDGAGVLRTLDEAEPLAVAIGLLRLVALGAGAALLLVTTLGLLARACGAAWLVVHVDRCTPAGMRRLLDRVVGVGLAASIGLSVVPAAADPGGDPPPSATLRRLPDATTTTLRRLPDGPEPPSPTTLRRLPDVPAPPASPAPPAEATPRWAPTPSKRPGHHEVVVRPGDSFWLLAERHEAQRLGRQPSEAEVGACWQELVAVNRHRLAVRDDPDLLFPGQTLIVPCP